MNIRLIRQYVEDLKEGATDVPLILSRMRLFGSSIVLTWGEDTNVWECSWITGGVRFTGVGYGIVEGEVGSRFSLQTAIANCLDQFLVNYDEKPPNVVITQDDLDKVG